MRKRRIAELQESAEFDEALREGLKQNSSASNYFDWIYDLCSPYLGDKVLEIGAGIGDMTARFSQDTVVHATEVSSASRNDLIERFKGNSNVFVTSVDIFQPQGEVYSSAVLVNVLEHIKDDERALMSLKDFIRSDGYLILYSPAFWLLYSNHDRAIGHYRRYRRSEVRELLTTAGYEVVQNHYVNIVGGIGWLIYCKLLKRPANEGGAVGLMNKVIIPVMRRIEQRVHMPFGISLFTVAKPVG